MNFYTINRTELLNHLKEKKNRTEVPTFSISFIKIRLIVSEIQAVKVGQTDRQTHRQTDTQTHTQIKFVGVMEAGWPSG